MAYLRSCYDVDCRFFADNLAHVSTLRWYWAATDAGQLGIPSPFYPLLWSAPIVIDPTGVAEVPGAPRRWTDGTLAGGPARGALDGLPEWFRIGCPWGVPGLARLPSGIPVGCASLDPCGVVGYGGNFVVQQTGFAPDSWTLFATGGFPPWRGSSPDMVHRGTVYCALRGKGPWKLQLALDNGFAINTYRPVAIQLSPWVLTYALEEGQVLLPGFPASPQLRLP